MKNIILLLMTQAFFFPVSFSQKADLRPDTKKLGLKSGVESITEMNYAGIDRGE